MIEVIWHPLLESQSIRDVLAVIAIQGLPWSMFPDRAIAQLLLLRDTIGLPVLITRCLLCMRMTLAYIFPTTH
jgi:hypothetical protein